MLHTEVIECLKELDDETLAKIMRMIFDWYDEKPVEPQSQLEKFAWKMILPKLQTNKETYLALVERNKENGKKGGRPKITENPNNPVGLSGNPEKHNYNYNYNNSSKEELYYAEQPSSPKGDEVVSKGLESLEKLFPDGRNYVGIDELNLWNKLSQQEKQVMIKRASMYIRNEKKKDDGKYIKGIGKFMKEQAEKGFEEAAPSIKNSTKSDDPRLLKMVDGNVYSVLLSKVSNSTRTADKLYHLLNKKTLFSTKDELLNYAKELNQTEINHILN